MKVIFLDIDGVLIKLFEKVYKDFQHFDKDLADIFKNILYVTDANVVISSSWRGNMETVRDAFISANIPWNRVISKTGYNAEGRDCEILDWLVQYKKTCKKGYEITNWIAIDDDSFDMNAVDALGNFLHINSGEGITKENAKEIIRKLS